MALTHANIHTQLAHENSPIRTCLNVEPDSCVGCSRLAAGLSSSHSGLLWEVWVTGNQPCCFMMDLSEEESKKKQKIQLVEGSICEFWKRDKAVCKHVVSKMSSLISCILLLAKPYFSLPFDTSSLSSYYIYLDVINLTKYSAYLLFIIFPNSLSQGLDHLVQMSFSTLHWGLTALKG